MNNVDKTLNNNIYLYQDLCFISLALTIINSLMGVTKTIIILGEFCCSGPSLLDAACIWCPPTATAPRWESSITFFLHIDVMSQSKWCQLFHILLKCCINVIFLAETFEAALALVRVTALQQHGYCLFHPGADAIRCSVFTWHSKSCWICIAVWHVEVSCLEWTKPSLGRTWSCYA